VPLVLFVIMAQASSSAMGEAFIASKVGTVKGKALNTQKFLFNSFAVSCSGATVKSLVEESALEFDFSKDKVAFSGCEAGKNSVTISEAEYEFAAEGLLSLDSAFVITDASAGCSLKVLQTTELPLATVKYVNGTSKLEVDSTVTGLSYDPSGGACGSAKTATNGRYEGNLSLELEGGTLKWGEQAVESVEKGPITFTAGAAMSVRTNLYTFHAHTVVKKASIDNGGTGEKFKIIKDGCTEKGFQTGEHCDIEVEFNSPAAGLWTADLDLPYRFVTSGNTGLLSTRLIRPM